MISKNIGSLSSLDSIKQAIQTLNEYGVSTEDLVNEARVNSSEFLVYESEDIDLKTTGLNTLFTVPFGKEFFLSSLIIRCTGADGITTEASIDLGFNDPDYDNFTSNLLLEDLLTSSDFYKATISAATKIMSAGDELKMNVAIASIGTSQTVKVYVSGLLRAI